MSVKTQESLYWIAHNSLLGPSTLKRTVSVTIDVWNYCCFFPPTLTKPKHSSTSFRETRWTPSGNEPVLIGINDHASAVVAEIFWAWVFMYLPRMHYHSSHLCCVYHLEATITLHGDNSFLAGWVLSNGRDHVALLQRAEPRCTAVKSNLKEPQFVFQFKTK